MLVGAIALSTVGAIALRLSVQRSNDCRCDLVRRCPSSPSLDTATTPTWPHVHHRLAVRQHDDLDGHGPLNARRPRLGRVGGRDALENLRRDDATTKVVDDRLCALCIHEGAEQAGTTRLHTAACLGSSTSIREGSCASERLAARTDLCAPSTGQRQRDRTDENQTRTDKHRDRTDKRQTSRTDKGQIRTDKNQTRTDRRRIRSHQLVSSSHRHAVRAHCLT